MAEFTQKYAVVSLLEDVAEGFEFTVSDWPLHMTLVGTFATDLSADRLQDLLGQVAKSTKPFETVATQDEYFGLEKHIHVLLLEKTTELVELHYKIIEAIKPGGLTLNDPQYSQQGYLPHSTVQKHARIRLGETIIITNIALIDMFPVGNPYRRKILKLFELK